MTAPAHDLDLEKLSLSADPLLILKLLKVLEILKKISGKVIDGSKMSHDSVVLCIKELAADYVGLLGQLDFDFADAISGYVFYSFFCRYH